MKLQIVPVCLVQSDGMLQGMKKFLCAGRPGQPLRMKALMQRGHAGRLWSTHVVKAEKKVVLLSSDMARKYLGERRCTGASSNKTGLCATAPRSGTAGCHICAAALLGDLSSKRCAETCYSPLL